MSMRQTHLLTKTRKDAPADEVAKNAALLIKAGFIHKEAAGIYSYLPLGERVLTKISNIIRNEMNALGGQEVFLSAFQPAEAWQKTNRWDLPVWFKTKLVSGGELGLGWTHEEAITAIMKNHIASYKDLPKAVYQIQTKFRNEERAKSGLLRGREFMMKDLYSFHADTADLEAFHERCRDAYLSIFRQIGLGEHTYLTVASGGHFSKYSFEFQTLSKSGEDTIYLARQKKLAVNKEILSDDVLAEYGLLKNELEEQSAIEVGNIFKLGTRFSEPIGLSYKDEAGALVPVVMGSYGIGPSRLFGTIAEIYSDNSGLKWPDAVAPFAAHLVAVGGTDEVREEADRLFDALDRAGIETLYDDRQTAQTGEKFADADLIGIPFRIVVSTKSLDSGGAEIKRRTETETRVASSEETVRHILDAYHI